MTEDTIGGLVRKQARIGDRSFLVVDDRKLSYADAERRSRAIASALIDAGVGRGSRVAMLFGNGPDFALAVFAVTRIGAVAMPISTLSTAHEIRGMLTGADAEYFIATPSYRGKDLTKTVEQAIGADPAGLLMLPGLAVLRRIWFGIAPLEAQGQTDDARVAAMERQVSSADPMVVIHTSGSTSAPKGVTHSHGQMIRNMARQNAVRAYTDVDCLFANNPWFWVGGFAYSFLATFIAGAKLLCSSAPPKEMLDLLEAERPTMCNGVATTMLALANDPSFAARDLSFIRRGNLYPIMPPETRPADPELRYGLLGMTEAGSVCMHSPYEGDLPEAKRGAFGPPVVGVDWRVVDPETGQDGPAGELWLRGPNIMQGYYGRERHEAFDDDGWYHTGDMMTIDADGDFFFKGREGDIVRTSGAQVSPREVEAVISDVTGGRTSLIIGIPDAERGQLVTAVMIGKEPIDEAALRAALKERIAPYKIPRKWLTMEEKDLPILSSGKINLKALVEIVSGL